MYKIRTLYDETSQYLRNDEVSEFLNDCKFYSRDVAIRAEIQVSGLPINLSN